VTDLETTIEYLINHGSSMTINWGEDTGCYEVYWITGGSRFRGVSRNLRTAMSQAVENAVEHLERAPAVSGIG
jgi:hypothetical protein